MCICGLMPKYGNMYMNMTGISRISKRYDTWDPEEVIIMCDIRQASLQTRAIPPAGPGEKKLTFHVYACR